MPLDERLAQIAIEDEMRSSYLDYAMSVIVGRALPDVRDGMKPVHRRILYGMNEMGLAHNRPYRKSAKIVGEIMGNYHPHGDTAIYDTLVRMAQDFNMRYMLVDGQGNYGSMDGDPPAAMRYTEARMTRMAEEMLADIDMETVDFGPNYDESRTEPLVLPARAPNLLINGAGGIAVGYATNIPTHNVAEVVNGLVTLIDNPDTTIAQLMKDIPGPDFPTAGFIYGVSGIKQAYETGRGSIAMRARWTTEQLARGQWRIVVTELPHGVSVKQVMEEIEALANPKALSNKKEISQEQRRMKQFILDQVEGARDESDRKSKLRLVIEPRSSRQDPEELMAARIAPDMVAAREGMVLYRKVGCPRCNRTGYKGRVGIFQLLVMNDEIESLAAQNAHRDEIERAAAGAGMRSLWDDGIAKAAAGLTALEELARVVATF